MEHSRELASWRMAIAVVYRIYTCIPCSYIFEFILI